RHGFLLRVEANALLKVAVGPKNSRGGEKYLSEFGNKTAARRLSYRCRLGAARRTTRGVSLGTRTRRASVPWCCRILTTAIGSRAGLRASEPTPGVWGRGRAWRHSAGSQGLTGGTRTDVGLRECA